MRRKDDNGWIDLSCCCYWAWGHFGPTWPPCRYYAWPPEFCASVSPPPRVWVSTWEPSCSLWGLSHTLNKVCWSLLHPVSELCPHAFYPLLLIHPAEPVWIPEAVFPEQLGLVVRERTWTLKLKVLHCGKNDTRNLLKVSLKFDRVFFSYLKYLIGQYCHFLSVLRNKLASIFSACVLSKPCPPNCLHQHKKVQHTLHFLTVWRCCKAEDRNTSHTAALCKAFPLSFLLSLFSLFGTSAPACCSSHRQWITNPSSFSTGFLL